MSHSKFVNTTHVIITAALIGHQSKSTTIYQKAGYWNHIHKLHANSRPRRAKSLKIPLEEMKGKIDKSASKPKLLSCGRIQRK